LAAGIFAVLTFTSAATAADLYGENYNGPPDAYPYDDRRYAERDYPPPSGAYQDDDDYDRGDYRDRGRDESYEYRGSVKDGYPVPVPPPRYSDRSYGHDGGCVPRWQIRHRLRADGWTELRPIERAGDLATIRARREESGRMFTLKVDRCTGDIVAARPHRLREFGAFEPRPWYRDSRPY
jgi:hypothetical protein